ncbi:hypothetical protein JCM19045_528 [Bacillus sp. JCM 19045]|nr:hypothetical protein JCM19045_528 [Bacillus sp. JCM 19045]
MLVEMQQDQFNELYDLMTQSFPPDEFRPYEKQRALLEKPEYTVYIHQKNNEIGAFFATWQTNEFVFLEHFAVKESFRNGGLGTTLLKAFLSLVNKPVRIEVEPPQSDLEQRRVGFYERNGFHFSGMGYTQPALSEDLQPIYLNIMSYPEPLSEESFTQFEAWMFSHVYKKAD